MKRTYDIGIVGSGFAGSLLAMIARRLGQSVVLIEKATHPRTVIGESSTPLANLLLEELAAKYELPAILPLAKWGSWQRQYPQIGCGLKRGFSFYHHDRSRPDSSAPGRERQLLVAASPNDRVADTHWYRADFDHLLLTQAQTLGVAYFDETDLTSATRSSDGVLLEGARRHQALSFKVAFLIDATGPRGFLHRALSLRETELPDFPKTQALYSHFSGVQRLDDLRFGQSPEEPPYPIEDAAVHHVFDGGWVWVLRFNNGITSAGVAATDRVAAELNFADAPEAWQRLLTEIPVLREQFANAKLERPPTHLRRISFQSDNISGDNWALLPSAAGFVDPILSTGLPLALLGVSRIASLLDKDWGSNRFSSGLLAYAFRTKQELLASARLVGGLYANMSNFPVFSALSLLYFAAMSYSETVLRLGKAELAPSFLLYDDPIFGPATWELLNKAHRKLSACESKKFIDEVTQAIEPLNLAGLGDPLRRNWYPVTADDLLRSAWKVGADRPEVTRLLERSGFNSTIGCNESSVPSTAEL